MKGLIVEIYRSSSMDCSNHGVSSWATEALVTGPGIPEIFEADEFGDFLLTGQLRRERPVLLLQHGNLPGTVKLVPLIAEGRWTMFGGNFAYTSDSRFGDAVRGITGAEWCGAVPIHDRIIEG